MYSLPFMPVFNARAFDFLKAIFYILLHPAEHINGSKHFPIIQKINGGLSKYVKRPLLCHRYLQQMEHEPLCQIRPPPLLR
jgi:hypothetical protein